MEKSLIDLCSVFFDSAHRTPKYQETGIPALRPRDIVGGTLNMRDAAKVSSSEYDTQCKRYEPLPGDLVYSRELSYGWAAVLPASAKICLSQGMCVFRPIEGVSKDYLAFVLNSPFGREQAIRAAVGAAHPHINLGDIKQYKVPVCPAFQQAEIVKHLESVRSETHRLAALYQQKLTALDELKKSLLARAFAGELAT